MKSFVRPDKKGIPSVVIVPLILFIMALSACEKYDDSGLVDQLAALEQRVSKLEELCKELNTNVSSLRVLLTALQENDYVTSVNPVIQGQTVIGYTIIFTKSPSITIYHGNDADTPVISVEEIDGTMYWTVNGVFLTDKEGNKICATALDGITPQFRIMDGKWQLSFDGGKTWNEVGQATGDSMFKAITDDGEQVYIELANGHVINIPKYIALKLTLNDSDEVGINPGGKATVTYKLAGVNSKPTIKALCPTGWFAEIIQVSKSEGRIMFTAPETITDEEAIILVSDNEGRMVMATVNFTQGVVKPAKNTYQIEIAGGTVNVPITTNLNYTVQIPTADNSWIKLENTETRSLRVDSLTFQITRNTGISRSSEIKFVDDEGREMSTIVLMQEGNEPTLSVSNDSFTCDYNASSLLVSVSSNTEWKVTSSVSWCHVSPSSDSNNASVTISVNENQTNETRECVVTISTIKGNLSKTITVTQRKPPYYHIISSVEELIAFRNFINDGGEEQNARLAADITLSSTWQGIGTESQPFSGDFDGNGYRVSGLSSQSNHSGLFGVVKNATIHDLAVSGNFSNGQYMGGIAGKAVSSTIDNCQSSINISSGSYLGGIVGSSEGCTISNCAHTDNTIGNTSSIYVGGIAGNTSTQTEIYNCYNAGRIYGADCFGGIVGYHGDNCLITNCYNKAAFKDMYYISTGGGIVGYNCGRIVNSYSSGSMTCKTINGDMGMKMCGGVVGYNHTNSYCYCCYFLQQPPINNGLSYVGDKNWGTCSKCGPFDASGLFSNSNHSYSGNTNYLRTSLNQWVSSNQTDDNKYKSWRTDQGWPEFAN